MIHGLRRYLRHRKMFGRGLARRFDWRPADVPAGSAPAGSTESPLLDYFEAHRDGPGIWKWRHYFDIYHRHFARFRGRAVHVLEVGVYSGGSLAMWREYFGPACRVYGVDIQPACKRYEAPGIRVFIGDQANRDFWRDLRGEVPELDIVIDDGGHEPEQQIVTLEETLPHLRPGGVYLCEDVHRSLNPFASYVTGLVHRLNGWRAPRYDLADADRRIVCGTNEVQRHLHSIHSYPFVTVIEKAEAPRDELVAPKRGTSWEPFLS